ncbi:MULTISPECIES: D-2-hydroxyacid dehydrogenase [Methylosinus]|uniref:Glycerate dehydrogenase n=1 Tax=Methylosinus trichosporium (strain ATCC 35070 / NCIMB 11131 / UNIQEM 75 / OB3b) TaxID=595536 RepID=A0A2D2D0N5_METT3|nr:MULTISPECIES: D-2-hydroxyacid dehydrogenase [Methylosinus]ATQ68557.1 glycerate dehydrogenase [Methylosinus trichosporium OB3b]OBS52789.1 glycerate dehydrogenase [Methylosinus sp. 3S-1]
MSHKIVFLDRETLDANLRKPNFPHDYVEYAQSAPTDVVERLKGATIAITNKVPLREETLKQLPDLKLIAVAATGTDVIDKAYTTANGITVSNIRNYAFNTLPEHVIALIFALRRNLVNYVDSVRRGRWQEANQFCYFDYPIYDISGSTLGIIGYGALGKSIATRAEALGMKMLINDVVPGPNIVDIPTILREADVVTLNLPLTPQTKNLIGAKELASMKKTAILINTARGGIVDEQALADALRGGVIAGAGFDVLTVEPPKQGNILLDPTIPNLIVTPHVAWASKEAMQVLADQLVDNIDAFVAGAPRNLVTA